MIIEYGGFTRADGQRLVVPIGHYLNSKTSRGLSGVAWAASEELPPVPERLNLLYFSYAKNQFYAGKFALLQQHSYELLKAGFWGHKKGYSSSHTTS